MSQSNSISNHPPVPNQATDAPKLKGDDGATADASTVNTSGWDLLCDPFDVPPDVFPEDEGSLERLEQLLGPVGEEFTPSFRTCEPPRPIGPGPKQPPASCNSKMKLSRRAEEEITAIKEKRCNHLVQCVETINEISFHEFMYLLEQYALYISDDRYIFDRFTGEPILAQDAYTIQRQSDETRKRVPLSEDEGDDSEEETSSLSDYESDTPSTEGPPSTPHSLAVESKHARGDENKSNRTEKALQHQANTPSTCLGKRSRGKTRCGPGVEDNTARWTPRKTRNQMGNYMATRQKGKATGPNTLSKGFIIHHFRMTPVYGASRRWTCPFVAVDALPGRRCRGSFDAGALRSHIYEHVEAFQDEASRGKNPGSKMSCPMRSKDCKWDEDRGQLKTVGPNDSLIRHIMEVHLEINAYNCPCGSYLSRGDRDQLLRHLRNGHEIKLEKRRSAGKNVPAFVDIDDPSLVEDEKTWMRRNREDDEDEEDDRGEGSSNGVKRRRLF